MREFEIRAKTKRDIASWWPAVRADFFATLRSLAEEPEPAGAVPDPIALGCFTLRCERFTIMYSYDDKRVSVWVVHVNT